MFKYRILKEVGHSWVEFEIIDVSSAAEAQLHVEFLQSTVGGCYAAELVKE